MPPKRPHPDSSGHGGSRKEQKLAQKRDVRRAQPSTSRRPGSSSSSSATTQLPPQLDVTQHLKDRASEIVFVQRRMKEFEQQATRRAWQLLPRHARRRAASHNVLRLPSRLRAKGRIELKSSSTEAKTRSQIRKRLPNHPLSRSLARKEELLSRTSGRSGKTCWLETHLYHAKRFRMSRSEFDGPRWGLVLPEEPSMKGKKTDWRAATSGCAIFDASWEEWIRIGVKVAKGKGKAREDEMDLDGQPEGTQDSRTKAATIMNRVLLAAGVRPIGQDSLSLLPAQVLDAVLHSGNPGPSDRAVCPLSIHVVPASIVTNRRHAVDPSDDTTTSKNAENRPGQSRFLRKQLSLLPPPPNLSESSPDYEVLLRVHPAAVAELESSINRGITKHIKAVGEGAWKGSHVVVRRLTGPDAETVVGMEKAAKSGKQNPPGKSSSLPRLAAEAASPAPLSTNVAKAVQSRLDALQAAALRERSFSTFELYGPLSGSVLGGVLQPVASTSKAKLDVWNAITTTQTELPKCQEDRLVLHLRVHDPRLNYPYRNRKIINKRDGLSAEERKLKGISSQQLADEGSTHLLRNGQGPPRFSKGDFDGRRAKLTVPGAQLKPDSKDDVVSVLLVQRWSPSTTDSVSCLAGYTLLIPQGWSRAFLHALISTSARLLSLQGLRMLHLEGSTPSFPYDWIGSPSWKASLDWTEQKNKSKWERRPKAKQINWEKEGTKWPFGGDGMWSDCVKNGRRALKACESSSFLGHKDDVIEAKFHLAGDTRHLLSQAQLLRPVAADGGSALQRTTNAILPSVNAISSNPFVPVSLEALARGKLEKGDEVHLPWGAVTGEKATLLQVGSITSGGYSLSRGKGFALGAISREGWLASFASSTSGQDSQQQEGVSIFAVRSRKGGPLREVIGKLIPL